MERNVYINHAKWKEKEKEFNNKLTEIIEENKKVSIPNIMYIYIY